MTLFNTSRIQLAAALLTLVASLNVNALPSDRTQPLSIQSDTAERDDQKGTTTYAGAVIMKRGSMQITADKVVIRSEQDKITQVTAVGRPAQYSQTPRADQEPVVATANRIEYQISTDMLYLIENAALEQEGTSLSGNRIEYDAKKSIVKAGSTNEKDGAKKRVHMVIPPKSFTNDELKEEPEIESNDKPQEEK